MHGKRAWRVGCPPLPPVSISPIHIASKLPQGTAEGTPSHAFPSFLTLASVDPRALLIRSPRSQQLRAPRGHAESCGALLAPALPCRAAGPASPCTGTAAEGTPSAPPGHLLAAARGPHTSTTQSGEFVRMASEIILAPDWPMRFPCRLREGRKRSSGLDTGCSKIPSGFERSSPALHQPPASHPPHASPDLLQGPWSQRTLALRAPRQPGEQL